MSLVKRCLRFCAVFLILSPPDYGGGRLIFPLFGRFGEVSSPASRGRGDEIEARAASKLRRFLGRWRIWGTGASGLFHEVGGLWCPTDSAPV